MTKTFERRSLELTPDQWQRPLCHDGFYTCLKYVSAENVDRCHSRIENRYGTERNGLCAYQKGD